MLSFACTVVQFQGTYGIVWPVLNRSFPGPLFSDGNFRGINDLNGG